METFFLSRIKYERESDAIDWLYVHQNLIILRKFFVNFCYDKRIPCKITSIIRPKIQGISKSNTHAEGRAFDASVHGWSTDDIDNCVAECNKLYAQSIGGISQMDLKARAVIYHFGTGPHLHFQVRP